MQKVSKQSLAMIALSILLAISIALTFTFAALAQTRTATGTIKFSGSGSLEWSGFKGLTGNSGDNITFTLTEEDYTIAKDGTSATLTEPWWSSAKVKFANNSTKKLLHYRVSAVWDTPGCRGCEAEVVKGSLNCGPDGGETIDVMMTSVISNLNLTITESEKMTSEQTIKITAEFNYNAAYADE